MKKPKKPKKLRQTLCALVASALFIGGTGCIEQPLYAERDKIKIRALYRLQNKQGIIEKKSEFIDPPLEKIYNINWELMEINEKYRNQKKNGIMEGQDKWKQLEKKRAKKFYEKEGFSLLASIVAQAADVYTTKIVLDHGGIEMNPFLGKNPSMDKLIGLKSGYVLKIHLFGSKTESLKVQEYYLGAGIAIMAALWNYQVYEDIK